MRKTLLLLPMVLSASAFGQAAVDVSARLEIPIPTIQFEVVPQVVLVEPGIHVVPSYDEEVFWVDDRYWVRRRGVWFYSHHHRGHWVRADKHHVPGRLWKIKEGKYRRYKPHKGAKYFRPGPPPGHGGPGHDRRDWKHAPHHKGHGKGHDKGHHGRRHDDDDDGHGRGRGKDKHGKGR